MSIPNWKFDKVTSKHIYGSVISCVCVGDAGSMSEDKLNDLWTVMDSIIELNYSKYSIQVSTSVDVSILKDNYSPTKRPSKFKFKYKYKDLFIQHIFPHLNSTNTSLFVTIFHHKHMKTPKIGPANYLLEPGAPTFLSEHLQFFMFKYNYKYVYDAMVDSIHCAILDCRFRKVDISVLSGWPTGGHTDFTVENAKKYTGNLGSHVKTPRAHVECNCICSLLNEDKKDTSNEEFKHFGIDLH